MRIGTWNLAGKWGDDHLAAIRELDCDVLLLTEVERSTRLPGMHLHGSSLEMTPGRWWAAVASRSSMRPLPDPHGTSAMAEVEGVTFCSSVLPWRGCKREWTWAGRDTTERTAAAVEDIEAAAPDVWGGDWNNAMSGYDGAGSSGARRRILEAVAALGLTVATRDLPSQKPGVLSVDHIAVPSAWRIAPARRRSIARKVSDHDAYVLEVWTPENPRVRPAVARGA